jgi:D-beta-D-heptose 7-phosphate kinase/D-beta-D-heptose 1-phosphate adenosyltransferase
MNPQRAQDLLSRCAGRRVLLLGDLMMDEWVFGSVKRISPEAPIPVVTMPLTPEARAHKPGGAGNVAAILLGLGAVVRTVGVVGDDDYGRRLLADLAARGTDTSGVVTDPSRPTTHKLRIIAGRQQLLRIDTERDAPLDAGMCARLQEGVRAGLDQADVILVSDYAKGVVAEGSLPAGLIGQARRSGTPLCADPKPANIHLFRGASLVSPNEAEALQAAGPSVNAGANPNAAHLHSLPAPVFAAGWSLLQSLDAEAVFITRGDKGIAVFGPENAFAEVPALTGSGDVGDATGCGDAVSAASALALAAGATYLEAAEMGNAAGGVVSRFVGVHSPSLDEIVERLSRAR